MTHGHELAYPFFIAHPNGPGINYGLTKREYFAAMAMKGLLANYEAQKDMQDQPDYNGTNFSSILANNSVDFADALIKALNNNP